MEITIKATIKGIGEREFKGSTGENVKWKFVDLYEAGEDAKFTVTDELYTILESKGAEIVGREAELVGTIRQNFGKTSIKLETASLIK